MKIEKTYNPGDDFVILRVICPPLPDKNISVSVAALASGVITLDEQVELARIEGEARLERVNVINSLIGSQQ